MAIASDLIFTPPIIAVGAVTVPVNVGLAIGANNPSAVVARVLSVDNAVVVAYPLNVVFNVLVNPVVVTYGTREDASPVLVT